MVRIVGFVLLVSTFGELLVSIGGFSRSRSGSLEPIFLRLEQI